MRIKKIIFLASVLLIVNNFVYSQNTDSVIGVKENVQPVTERPVENEGTQSESENLNIEKNIVKENKINSEEFLPEEQKLEKHKKTLIETEENTQDVEEVIESKISNKKIFSWKVVIICAIIGAILGVLFGLSESDLEIGIGSGVFGAILLPLLYILGCYLFRGIANFFSMIGKGISLSYKWYPMILLSFVPIPETFLLDDSDDPLLIGLIISSITLTAGCLLRIYVSSLVSLIVVMSVDCIYLLIMLFIRLDGIDAIENFIKKVHERNEKKFEQKMKEKEQKAILKNQKTAREIALKQSQEDEAERKKQEEKQNLLMEKNKKESEERITIQEKEARHTHLKGLLSEFSEDISNWEDLTSNSSPVDTENLKALSTDLENIQDELENFKKSDLLRFKSYLIRLRNAFESSKSLNGYNEIIEKRMKSILQNIEFTIDEISNNLK